MVNEELPNKRNKIFISHANPNDNDFTKWLSLKLIALGYDVWCDILFLEKGVDFWKVIENEIRINTCKFLVVLSELSNKSEGVLKEIAVAEKIKKGLNDEGFITTLLIDEKLTYDNINIALNRLNAIDFKASWISGLRELDKSLTDNKIPKNVTEILNSYNIYKNIFLSGKNVIERDEIYNSNWFEIISFPQYLYFHAISQNDIEIFEKAFPFPVFKYKNYICTFSESIDYSFPENELFDSAKIIKILTLDIINGRYNSNFISNRDCRNSIIRLMNNGFKIMMKKKGFKTYPLSSKEIGFWFEKNQVEKDKINGVQFVGKIKDNNWHFGISGLLKLVPFPILILSSHIFFTTDGKVLIASKAKQQSLRIKQGKNWWNNKWNEKLLNIASYIASSKDKIYIPIGNIENIIVSSSSLKFTSRFSYNTIKDNIHEEDIFETNDEDFSENDEGILE